MRCPKCKHRMYTEQPFVDNIPWYCPNECFSVALFVWKEEEE